MPFKYRGLSEAVFNIRRSGVVEDFAVATSATREPLIHMMLRFTAVPETEWNDGSSTLASSVSAFSYIDYASMCSVLDYTSSVTSTDPDAKRLPHHV